LLLLVPSNSPQEDRTMTNFPHTLRTGLAAALLLTGLTTAAQGFVPSGGGLSFGVGGRSITLIKGTVLCAGCTVEEVCHARPQERKLYQLSHKRGQIVLQIHSINGSQMWATPDSPRLSVRAKDSVFGQLTAEETLRKEVEITGLLSNTRSLDIFTVTIKG
jgi:hypothetical protein